MFLKDRLSGDKVEVLDVQALTDPYKTKVRGRFHAGEELQDPQDFKKPDLCFLSGEALPKCWLTADYPH